jgi:hypothetical protein
MEKYLKKILWILILQLSVFNGMCAMSQESNVRKISAIIDNNIKQLDNTIILYTKVRNRPSITGFMSFKSLVLFGYHKDKMVFEELIRWDKQKPSDSHESFAFDGFETKNYNYGTRGAAIFNGKPRDIRVTNTFENFYRSIIGFYLPDVLNNLNCFKSEVINISDGKVECLISIPDKMKCKCFLNISKSYMPDYIKIQSYNNVIDNYVDLWEFKINEWLTVKDNVYIPKKCIMNDFEHKSPSLYVDVLLVKPNTSIDMLLDEYTFQQGTTYIDYRDGNKVKTTMEKPATGFGSRNGSHNNDKK